MSVLFNRIDLASCSIMPLTLGRMFLADYLGLGHGKHSVKDLQREHGTTVSRRFRETYQRTDKSFSSPKKTRLATDAY